MTYCYVFGNEYRLQQYVGYAPCLLEEQQAKLKDWWPPWENEDDLQALEIDLHGRTPHGRTLQTSGELTPNSKGVGTARAKGTLAGLVQMLRPY